MARIVSIAPARWITKDGRTLLPSDFDDAHLYNTVRKIRRDDWRREWLIFLESEMMRRGLRKELKILKITYPMIQMKILQIPKIPKKLLRLFHKRNLKVVETCEILYNYHLCEPYSQTSLCGKTCYTTAVPIEDWGVLTRPEETWCSKCDRLLQESES